MENGSGGYMRILVWLGGSMAATGALVLVGYCVYYLSKVFFGSRSVPLPIQIAIPAIVVGFLLVLGAVLLERLRSRKQEQFEEVGF